jgi:hypothetical protein
MSVPASWEVNISLPDSSLPFRRLTTTKCEACFTRRAFIESGQTTQKRSYIVQRGTLLPQCCLSRENGGHERPCSTCSLQSFPLLWPLSPSSPSHNQTPTEPGSGPMDTAMASTVRRPRFFTPMRTTDRLVLLSFGVNCSSNSIQISALLKSNCEPVLPTTTS